MYIFLGRKFLLFLTRWYSSSSKVFIARLKNSRAWSYLRILSYLSLMKLCLLLQLNQEYRILGIDPSSKAQNVNFLWMMSDYIRWWWLLPWKIWSHLRDWQEIWYTLPIYTYGCHLSLYAYWIKVRIMFWWQKGIHFKEEEHIELGPEHPE